MTENCQSGIEHYRSLKEKGAKPHEIYARARQDGLSQIASLRVFRELFDLSFAEAREIVREVDGYVPGELPPIRSYDEILSVLREELGYCGCEAYEDAISLLRDVLWLARQREQSRTDKAAFQRASTQLLERLGYELLPGLATWFLYFLDYRDLIWHGFRATDCGLTRKGRWILDALERFSPPSEVEDE